jgi:hypothetical protein
MDFFQQISATAVATHCTSQKLFQPTTAIIHHRRQLSSLADAMRHQPPAPFCIITIKQY